MRSTLFVAAVAACLTTPAFSASVDYVFSFPSVGPDPAVFGFSVDTKTFDMSNYTYNGEVLEGRSAGSSAVWNGDATKYTTWGIGLTGRRDNGDDVTFESSWEDSETEESPGFWRFTLDTVSSLLSMRSGSAPVGTCRP